MKHARFYLRRGDGIALPVRDIETDDEGRAKGYAAHWARVTGAEIEVRDRGDGGITLMWEGVPGFIVHRAPAPNMKGIPLPTPVNPPPAATGTVVDLVDPSGWDDL